MNIEQERITKLTREILVGVQKLTLGDFKDAGLVSEQITKLSLYRAHTSEGIKDKLLIVANSNWLDCEDALINYIEAWAYQDFDFIDRNTLALMSTLQAEGETFGDTDWLLLLNSVDADIKRFLSKISRV